MPAEPGPALGDGAGRRLEHDGLTWVAEVTGRGAVGFMFGSAAIESVHFRCTDERGPITRLAYLPAGIFAGLEDEELVALLRSAPPLVSRAAPESIETVDGVADGQPAAVVDYPGENDG